MLRDPPLAPAGVMARGVARDRLVARLLSETDERLLRLRGVATPDGMVAMGEALPWAEGVQYVAPDPDASSLWTLTARVPTVPRGLLQRAVLARCPQDAAPILLVDGMAIPLGPARPLVRARLRGWLAR